MATELPAPHTQPRPTRDAPLRYSLRGKLLFTMFGLIAGLMATLAWIEASKSQQLLEREAARRVHLMREVLVARGEGAASQLSEDVANQLAGFSFSAIAEALTNQTRLDPKLSYALVQNTNAQVLAHAGARGTLIHFTGSLLSYPDRDALHASRQLRPGTRTIDAGGAEVLEVITPLHVSNVRWGVLRLGYSLAELHGEIAASRLEMEQEVRAVILRSLSTAGAIVLLGMLAAVWLSSFISEPLHRVTEAASLLAKGDFSAAAALNIRSQDEVGVLAEAFQKMSSQLQRTYAALEESNRTLEGKVSARTLELNRMTQLAEEAQRFAEAASRTKSAFLASMSHELRTPLTAIIGFSEMLLAEAQDQGRTEAAEDHQRILDSGRHLLHLINEILDLSKIEAQKMELDPEHFEVADLLHEVSNTLTPLLRQRGNRIILTAAANLGSLHADPTKLRQSLLNLLGNANKFTEQGAVRLTAERLTRDGAAFLRFTVADTGIGMTPAQLGQLFQPFQQVDSSAARKYGGTGLGLAITRKLCELMGGSVHAASELGKGSTFTLELPAGEVPPAAQASTEAPTTRTVLVLSPDPHVHALVRETLQGTGCELCIAPSGADGLQLARALRPVLITLDAAGPVAAGWSVMGELKSDPELASIPVILLTLKDGQPDMGFALGAAEFVAKPVNSALLGRVLRRHLRFPAEGSILLVENDPFLREVMTRMIENEGRPVTSAENGLLALEQVRRQIPALILLDLMMPVMDGFQFLNELRQRPEWAHIPVVVLTAKSLSPEEHAFLSSRTASVLQKGANIRADVVASIRQHITQSP